MSIVVVQHIRTSWGKDSRGGANAVWRNQTPEAAKVSVEHIEQNQPHLVYQYLGYDGSRQLTEQVTLDHALPFDAGSIIVSHKEDGVLAEFRWTRYGTGAPNREWMRKTLHIAMNNWGQFVYNGRFSANYEGGWWYEKHVVNVGLFERVTPSIFTREAPTYRFDASAHLF